MTPLLIIGRLTLTAAQAAFVAVFRLGILGKVGKPGASPEWGANAGRVGKSGAAGECGMNALKAGSIGPNFRR